LSRGFHPGKGVKLWTPPEELCFSGFRQCGKPVKQGFNGQKHSLNGKKQWVER